MSILPFSDFSGGLHEFYKVCSKCKIDKPLIEYSKDRSRTDGYCIQCRSCKAIDYLNNNLVTLWG